MNLTGIPIEETQRLVGQPHAAKIDGVVYVSPAVMSLIRSEQGEKLEALLRSLKVIDLDWEPKHDAQWHADDMQIKLAQINGIMKGGA